jgi:predicted regulator of Ras-like GTPase activity (Roadblock/LC7/MglB family)
LQRTISAHSGVLEPRPDENLFFLTLFDGEIQEINLNKLEEFRRVQFVKHRMSLNAGNGIFWQRSEADDRTDREKSVAQMRQEARENRDRSAWLAQRINLVVGSDLDRQWGRAFGLAADTLARFFHTPAPHASLLAQQKQSLAQIEGLIREMQQCQYVAQMLMVEIHKKYAIPAACLVFVLVGAPLGVLARRGGFVSGLSLSLGFFLLYWALLISGEDLADRQIVSPFAAMWSANFVIGSLGIYVFGRIALGRVVPRSWRRPYWRRFFEKRESVDAELRVPKPELAPPPSPMPEPLSRIPIALPQLEFTPIPEVLRHLAQSVRADLVLLADSNGVPLAFCKTPTTPHPNPDFEMIAKLAASQMAATQIVGQHLGEEGAFTCIFQESARYNLFIYQIDQDFLLIVLAERTVRLGLTRIHANETVPKLRKVLEAFR